MVFFFLYTLICRICVGQLYFKYNYTELITILIESNYHIILSLKIIKNTDMFNNTLLYNLSVPHCELN